MFFIFFFIIVTATSSSFFPTDNLDTNKSLIFIVPKLVNIYLSFIALLTVDSCIFISSEISFKVIGFIELTPFNRKSFCFSTIFSSTLYKVDLLCSILFTIDMALFNFSFTYSVVPSSVLVFKTSL